MTLAPQYCSQCGGPVITKTIEDRPRQVCRQCDTVFYQNPLPVVAAVVLNAQREVLLVKRRHDPYRGLWCLPIGFAEMGETIGQATRRELREETGIEGQIIRLLDADSFTSEQYGELLIVTFELQKAAGQECAGDDAEEGRYFTLDQVPLLAFSSNAKALHYCIKAHEDEWAIQDSFKRLQADEGTEMLSDALVRLVEDHAEEVTRLWFDDIRGNPSTQSYRTIDAEQLYQRGYIAISQFGRWLKGREAEEEVRDFYHTLGKERQDQGFGVHEVISSLTLLRKYVWTYARGQGVWEKPIDVYRVLELNRRIAVFFDKALYHTARGFEEPRRNE